MEEPEIEEITLETEEEILLEKEAVPDDTPKAAEPASGAKQQAVAQAESPSPEPERFTARASPSPAPSPYILVEGGEGSYPNFFQLKRGPEQRDPTPTETFFCQSINDVLRAAETYGGTSDLDKQMAALRDEFAFDAREIADRFLRGENPLQSIEDFASRNGEFKNAVKALSDVDRAVNIERDSNGIIEDVQFNLRSYRLTEQQEELFVEIQKVITVIKVVFASRLQSRGIQNTTSVYKRGEYLQKLSEIAMTGLTSPDKVRFASLALQ